jgi:hypothetical protein
MKAIFLFGDSYADPNSTLSPANSGDADNTYVKLLSNYYNCPVINTAKGGASNEYIIEKFFDTVEQIKENDIVIFLPTWHGRKWLIEELPALSAYLSLAKFLGGVGVSGKELSQEEISYCTEVFLKSLDSFEERKSKVYIKMMLSTLSEYQRKIGFKSIVVNTFAENEKYDNFINTSGRLHLVNGGEFADIKNFHENYRDFRYNHLSVVNHAILAEKIIKAIESGEDIDLNSDFKEKIVYAKDIEEYRINYKKIIGQ